MVLVAAATASPALAAEKESAGELIRQGTALHDEGRYDEAIARYRRALAVEPGNATALYELAFSSHAKKDYGTCLEAANAGLRNPGEHEARLHSEKANCLDDSGHSDEAMAVYREALAKHAHDARLRFNYAVALWRVDKADDAIAETVTTIGDDPAYSSPYMLLATVEHEQGRDEQALFAFLRYLMVDRTSPRAESAAVLAYGLFERGVSSKPPDASGKKNIEVAISSDALQQGGLYSTLAVSRSLAAASMHSEDGPEGRSEADRLAKALATYLAIAGEVSSRPEHAAVTGGAEWQLVTAPVLALHEKQVATAFCYAVAEAAKVAGASSWRSANGDAMRQLEAALTAAGG